MSINSIAAGKTFIVPPNVTAISTELAMTATSTLKVLDGGILRVYGIPSIASGATIEGEDRIQYKDL